MFCECFVDDVDWGLVVIGIVWECESCFFLCLCCCWCVGVVFFVVCFCDGEWVELCVCFGCLVVV